MLQMYLLTINLTQQAKVKTRPVRMPTIAEDNIAYFVDITDEVVTFLLVSSPFSQPLTNDFPSHMLTRISQPLLMPDRHKVPPWGPSHRQLPKMIRNQLIILIKVAGKGWYEKRLAWAKKRILIRLRKEGVSNADPRIGRVIDTLLSATDTDREKNRRVGSMAAIASAEEKMKTTDAESTLNNTGSTRPTQDIQAMYKGGQDHAPCAAKTQG